MYPFDSFVRETNVSLEMGLKAFPQLNGKRNNAISCRVRLTGVPICKQYPPFERRMNNSLINRVTLLLKPRYLISTFFSSFNSPFFFSLSFVKYYFNLNRHLSILEISNFNSSNIAFRNISRTNNFSIRFLTSFFKFYFFLSFFELFLI